MDRTLKVVFEDCLQCITVARPSKVLTSRHFTFVKDCPFIVPAAVKIDHVNLDAAVIKGRGLRWFTRDGLNSFTINLKCPDITLASGAVKVHFGRPGAEVVNVEFVGCMVQILYRAGGGEDLKLTVTVCDQIVSESTVQPVMRADKALAELRHAPNPPRCVAILSCLCDNAAVVVTVLSTLSQQRSRGWVALPAKLVLDVMGKHATKAQIQWLGFVFLSWFAHSGRVENILAVDGWDARVYDAMDAFPDDTDVQIRGCGLCKRIADKSVSGKEILLSGRATEVCQRARLIVSYYANEAIEALR
jgi:hypothetical protein